MISNDKLYTSMSFNSAGNSEVATLYTTRTELNYFLIDSSPDDSQ